MARFILSIEVALPPKTPRLVRLTAKPLFWIWRRGVIATFPRYMRQLFGLNQGRFTDVMVTPANKLTFFLMNRFTWLYMMYLEFMAPQGAPVVAPVKLEIPPVNPQVFSPREVQERLGLDIPSEAHLELRATQRNRVLVQHLPPSDEGLAESQRYIGALDPHDAGRVG